MIESRNNNSEVKNIYDIYLGAIMSKMNFGRTPNFTYRDGIRCPSASGRSHFLRDFKRWIRKLFSSAGIIDESEFTGWFNVPDNENNNGGSYGGYTGHGGNGGKYDNNWNNWRYHKTVWKNTPNYNCVMENLEILQSSEDFDINIFNDPCSYGKASEYDLILSLIFQCARDKNESTFADEENRNDFYNHIKDKTTPDCEECIDALENFKNKYGIDLTVKEYEDIYYSISNCNDQDEFDKEVEKAYNKTHEDAIDISNSDYSGEKENIPNCIKINDNTNITVNFGNNADQEVAVCLIDALVEMLKCVSKDFDITSIYISATTNGTHAKTSNHFKALAIDFSRINGKKMALMNDEELKVVNKMQECLEEYSGIRENFGPKLKKKLGEDYEVAGHTDHIHFSVNSEANCTYNADDVKCN